MLRELASHHVLGGQYLSEAHRPILRMLSTSMAFPSRFANSYFHPFPSYNLLEIPSDRISGMLKYDPNKCGREHVLHIPLRP